MLKDYLMFPSFVDKNMQNQQNYYHQAPTEIACSNLSVAY